MFMRMKFGLLNPSAEFMVKVLIRNTQNTDIMIYEIGSGIYLVT